LARRLGAEIFATAGSEVKRQYLRSLGVPHVFDSRSLAFAREVREASGGRGVDVVLNSLSGDFLRESVKLLAPFGRFLEIGKRDIYENRRLGLYGLRQNASWAAIDADLLFRERPAEARRLLAEVLGLLDAGELEPLPIEIFPVDQAEGAFHHMAQARHLGKVVLSLAEADRTPLLPRAGESLHRSACYLLTGGLGGIGLALAEHMVRQEGARHLVLVGRSAASPVAAERLAALTALGARIDTAKVDVADRAAVAKLVERLRRAGAKVRGVVHAAGVLDDGVLGSLDAGRFRRVLLPKMAGAFHLASALEGEPLDFFLLCSSVTSMLGSAGQGNYAAANAGLDALAERLRRAGLPALSVAWGPWQGVGMTQTGDAEAQLARRGLAPIPLEAALAAFRSVLYRPEAQLGVGEWNLERFAEVHQLGAAASLFRGASKPRTPSTQSRSPFAELAAGDPRLLREKVAGYLRGLVGEVLRLEAGRVDAETPLRSQGLDSLMTVELRNRLEEGLGMRLSSSLIWNYPTVTALADHLGAVIEERWGAPSATAEPAEAALASQAEEALLSLSDDDAEAMLIQELESLDY
ncbi:MAG TPA: SDR family NAD(P)-dependent oxidoreductase, partial [Thermoanaerobaculia bacterium]|nr:SDR family NAD(P)-dependent oxidoreductase [Thermoanaerobaculia bacterium]